MSHPASCLPEGLGTSSSSSSHAELWTDDRSVNLYPHMAQPSSKPFTLHATWSPPVEEFVFPVIVFKMRDPKSKKPTDVKRHFKVILQETIWIAEIDDDDVVLDHATWRMDGEDPMLSLHFRYETHAERFLSLCQGIADSERTIFKGTVRRSFFSMEGHRSGEGPLHDEKAVGLRFYQRPSPAAVFDTLRFFNAGPYGNLYKVRMQEVCNHDEDTEFQVAIVFEEPDTTSRFVKAAKQDEDFLKNLLDPCGIHFRKLDGAQQQGAPAQTVESWMVEVENLLEKIKGRSYIFKYNGWAKRADGWVCRGKDRIVVEELFGLWHYNSTNALRAKYDLRPITLAEGQGGFELMTRLGELDDVMSEYQSCFDEGGPIGTKRKINADDLAPPLPWAPPLTTSSYFTDANAQGIFGGGHDDQDGTRYHQRQFSGSSTDTIKAFDVEKSVDPHLPAGKTADSIGSVAPYVDKSVAIAVSASKKIKLMSTESSVASDVGQGQEHCKLATDGETATSGPPAFDSTKAGAYANSPVVAAKQIKMMPPDPSSVASNGGQGQEHCKLVADGETTTSGLPAFDSSKAGAYANSPVVAEKQSKVMSSGPSSVASNSGQGQEHGKLAAHGGTITSGQKSSIPPSFDATKAVAYANIFGGTI